MRTLIIGTVCLLLSSQTWAQEEKLTNEKQVKHILSTNPILMMGSWFSVKYERGLNDKSSLVVLGDGLAMPHSTNLPYFGFGVGYKRYLSYKSIPVPGGVYLQPSFRWFLNKKGSIYIPGAEMGYLFMWRSGVSMDLGWGIGLYMREGKVDVGPLGVLNIGYTWQS